jgi:hypothetical protein
VGSLRLNMLSGNLSAVVSCAVNHVQQQGIKRAMLRGGTT